MEEIPTWGKEKSKRVRGREISPDGPMWSRSGTYPRRRWLLCRAGSSEGLWNRRLWRPEITKTALGAGASYSGRLIGAPGREKSRTAPSHREAREREEETFPRTGETRGKERQIAGRRLGRSGMTNVRMVSQKCHRVAWEHEVGIQCEVVRVVGKIR